MGRAKRALNPPTQRPVLINVAMMYAIKKHRLVTLMGESLIEEEVNIYQGLGRNTFLVELSNVNLLYSLAIEYCAPM